MSKNAEDELHALFSALAESVVNESPEAIVEEAGGKADASAVADRVRSLLLTRLQLHRKQRLEEARRAYDEASGQRADNEARLPRTPEARRRLLARVFAQIPLYGEALLTAQHREFKSLEDDDVASMLRQLAALGVLDRIKGGDEE